MPEQEVSCIHVVMSWTKIEPWQSSSSFIRQDSKLNNHNRALLETVVLSYKVTTTQRMTDCHGDYSRVISILGMLEL